MTSSCADRLLGILRDGAVVLALAVVTACSAELGRDPATENGDASTAVAVAAEALKAAPVQGTANTFFFGFDNNAKNIETASAVIPPNVNAACPAGRAFITMGAFIQWMDLDCLSNPNGIAGCHLDGAKSGQIRIDDWVAAQFPQKVNTFFNVGTGTCTNFTTARMFVQGGADSAATRTGTNGENILVMFAGERRMTRPTTTWVCPLEATKTRCAPERANNVNFTMRSTDCGANWTVSKIVDNGDGNGFPSATAPRPGGSNTPQWCGNLDMFLLHRNPYSPSAGSKFVYAIGGTGPDCCGGAIGHAVYRSSDDGQSFTYKATLNVGNTGNPNGKAANPFTATVWPDGTVGLFGCGAQVPRAYWSRGTDDVVWNVLDGALSMPACQMLPASEMPAKLRTMADFFATMSRVTDPSLNASYNYARIAYPTLEADGTGGTRTSLVRGFFAIPRNGAVVTPFMTWGDTLAGRSASNSFFRASFASDNYFPTGPDTAVLYWQEGDGLGQYFTRYAAVSGLRNYAPARNLSVTSTGGPRAWTPNFVPAADGTRWAGEFDRPSFYQVAGESTNLNDVYHAFTAWTESHASDADSGYVHYSTVDITRPRFGAFSRVSSSVSLKAGMGPAAVTVPAASPAGEKHIHVYAVDTSNRVRRIRYTVSSGSWTSWTDTQGITTQEVAATSWGTGRVDVFAIGQDNMMWHLAEQDGVTQTCCPWESLGGPNGGFIARPAAASQRTNQLFLVGIGTGGNVWYRTYKGSWSSWAPLAGGIALGGAAAVSWGAGRIDVFVRGQNGHLWHYWANDDGTNTWEGKGVWEDLAGAPADTPAVTSDASGRLHVFALDADGQVQHLWYDSGWSDWHTIGGMSNADPGAASVGSTKVAALARGLDGFLWWSRRGF